MWVTFAPCLYIFVDYYFQHASTLTTNAIHSLSSVYMFLYPLVIHFTFPVFDDTIIRNKTNSDNTDSSSSSPMTYVVPGSGLKRGIMIGAVLNLFGAMIRWYGGSSPTLCGFFFLFIGQTLAALAQVFMLAIPPQLAVAWFPASEINFATAIAVSANNLGIAMGCLWSPWAIKQATMMHDIPRLLFCQFLLCSLVLIMVWSAFQKQPPYNIHTSAALPGDNSHGVSPTAKLFKEKNFKYLLLAYGVIFGAQCAIITLIDQVLLPPFADIISEGDVGLLSCATLSIGVPGSILVGHYLDKTKKYRHVCNILSLLTTLSLIALYLSIECKYVMGVVTSCILFGASSYSIAPAIFQYCGELFYPINEIIPTGYLFLVGNIGGVVLVAFMGWTENANQDFNMRWPLLCLLATMILGTLAMTRVNGVLKRSMVISVE
ncbi:major facilitator superfamily domain-containing protein [Absidia repens]|uniref:Major facilitator superfamily domain-containing protein n=1 Tax=Absidia repens TaxID=90262 RepID=A0A1X2IKS8_9FUNG|nr:major facilitator superfamily domain-containing protein [Absidia repens]